MSEKNWRDYFTLDDAFRSQVKQIEAWTRASLIESFYGKTSSWLYELFTGYGKTLAAYGTYWILKQRGLVKRMIVLVPTDDQRTQFADDVEDANRLLGTKMKAWVFTNDVRDLRAFRSGKYDVFVASYQQLRDRNCIIRQMMEMIDAWLVVGDECHHLGEDGTWARRFVNLPNTACRIGLSATPIRTDLQVLLGLPRDPTVKADYKQALEEKIVKTLTAKIDHHFVMVDIDGVPTKLTTADLKRDMTEGEEGACDFSRYETRRQLRYNNNYVYKAIIDPINELASRLMRHPSQHQQVVCAMSCKHAHYVCNQYNMIFASLGLSYLAKWVGVGVGMDGETKTDAENAAMMKDFKEGRFEVLVHVNKASESFNNKRVSTLVILHLIGAPLRLIQQIGRALRRNESVPYEEDTAVIFASADTEVADVVRRMEADAREVHPRIKEDNESGRDGWLPFPDWTLIDSFFDRSEIVLPDGIAIGDPDDIAFCNKWNIPIEEYLLHESRKRFGPKPMPSVSSPGTSKDNLISFTNQVKDGTRRLCGAIIKVLESNGRPFDKKNIGKIMKAINYQWVKRSKLSHDAMLPDEFKAKYQWLKDSYNHIEKTREVPQWLKL